jgi:hypothetical protein
LKSQVDQSKKKPINEGFNYFIIIRRIQGFSYSMRGLFCRKRKSNEAAQMTGTKGKVIFFI